MAKKEKTSQGQLETNMLAFARSLQITEGVFFGITGTREIPIEVQEKGVRGQTADAKGDNAGKSNPQTVEFAAVPQGCNAIELRFSVRVLPGAMRPHACDKSAVAEAYKKLAEAYARRDGFVRLAELYIWNLANGRFAWRNRWQTDSALVTLRTDALTLVFNPLHPIFGNLEIPVAVSDMAAALADGSTEADLRSFIDRFAQAMEHGAFNFSVVWRAVMEPGQEVFPSQEYIRKETDKENGPSRVFAKLPFFHHGETLWQASMHSQKIGAALRHIDIWHGDSEHGAIAVNPYGGVQESGSVLRDKGSKISFYELRKQDDMLFGALDDETAEIPGDVHFVMANLVRGGVFGSAKDS
jgi:CRISPR-associated protein Csy3